MSDDSVSRETPPRPTVQAADLFGAYLPLVERYAGILADAGVTRGLIGPREVARLWDRHIVNCGLVAAAFDEQSTVCDVGSGAGLPGMVLAMARPDLKVTLLEPLLRRAAFLQQTTDALSLPNVTVLRGRAEENRGLRFDAVTARAVAPLDRLARWTLPLCRPGGRLVAIKGESAAGELAAHETALRRLGATAWSVKRYAQGAAVTVAIEVVAGETDSRARRMRSRQRAQSRPTRRM